MIKSGRGYFLLQTSNAPVRSGGESNVLFKEDLLKENCGFHLVIGKNIFCVFFLLLYRHFLIKTR